MTYTAPIKHETKKIKIRPSISYSILTPLVAHFSASQILLTSGITGLGNLVDFACKKQQ
ncbi:hypothetical protein PACTADRAFT_52170 [Pachysolen tannophilus NRRL Y-2460]|uniref:Uncharacterized protein n=1 Tax=Pachysolen tannophilus NRRL Y-2460 TaxID=669874 RepID=A0A1E4TMW0_PACTA|nr:hypothetical protein PACTADRAFT_52170 [Pachysolen tannophilus NRRL Y-2460]